MVLKQMLPLFVSGWEGSRTEFESKLRGALLQLASRKGETH